MLVQIKSKMVMRRNYGSYDLLFESVYIPMPLFNKHLWRDFIYNVLETKIWKHEKWCSQCAPHLCNGKRYLGDKCRKLGRRWQVSLRETRINFKGSLKEQVLFSYSISGTLWRDWHIFLWKLGAICIGRYDAEGYSFERRIIHKIC